MTVTYFPKTGKVLYNNHFVFNINTSTLDIINYGKRWEKLKKREKEAILSTLKEKIIPAINPKLLPESISVST